MNERFTKLFLTLILALSLITATPFISLAHSGRTDSNGGHKDNKNVSGLGYYHYHHGYGPHLHPDGICPYSTTVSKPVIDTLINDSASSIDTFFEMQKLKDDLMYSKIENTKLRNEIATLKETIKSNEEKYKQNIYFLCAAFAGLLVVIGLYFKRKKK